MAYPLRSLLGLGLVVELSLDPRQGALSEWSSVGEFHTTQPLAGVAPPHSLQKHGAAMDNQSTPLRVSVVQIGLELMILLLHPPCVAGIIGLHHQG